MLLKNHFSHEPPEGYFDSLWLTVSERAEESAAGGDGVRPGGGPPRDDELVFKSTPAMDFLNIPERRPPPVESRPVSEATEPPAPVSPWRWPVALMVTAAIVVVGYLAYKKMTPPPTTVAAVAPAEPAETEPAMETPTSPATADAGMQVAALTPSGDGGPAALGEGNDTAAEPSEPRHARARRHKRGHRHHGAKKGPEEAKPAAPAPAPAKPAAKEPPKPASGKKNALDNLLDDAIGADGAPKVAKKAEAPKPAASDLPEQLNMNQIRNAMNRVKARVQACYDQFQVEGMANVGFSILGSGKISDVSIRGKFRGTDTGDCVVKAVKQASFPKFSGKPMTIKNYPFLLQ